MADDMIWAGLDGWRGTEATRLVGIIDGMLPTSWERVNDGPGRWLWTHTDTIDYVERTRGVVVNASPRQILVPVRGWPERVGPTVFAYTSPRNLFATVTLPNLTDHSDIEEALSILAAVVPELRADADQPA